MTTVASVAERLSAVRGRIAEACDRAGRNPSSVTLVGITKGQPAEAAAEAVAAGLADLGENRAQELVSKAAAVSALGRAPRWHFVGHVQRNKVREVLPQIAALHSLDSVRLAATIDEALARRGAGVRLPCYVEVNVGGEETKQGIEPPALPALLRAVAAYRSIDVVGLMTVAPPVDDPELVRPVFRELRALASAHGLAGLSMGMTDDYAVAIEEGATLVRVGRALFGPRAA